MPEKLSTDKLHSNRRQTQFKMPPPHKRAKTVPPIKNGPKGICESIFLAPLMTKKIPTTEPLKNASIKARPIIGQPSINPIRNASLTSPNPMPRPRVKTTIARKKPAAAKADKSGFKNPQPPRFSASTKRYKKVMPSAGQRILSGIR